MACTVSHFHVCKLHLNPFQAPLLIRYTRSSGVLHRTVRTRWLRPRGTRQHDRLHRSLPLCAKPDRGTPRQDRGAPPNTQVSWRQWCRLSVQFTYFFIPLSIDPVIGVSSNLWYLQYHRYHCNEESPWNQMLFFINLMKITSASVLFWTEVENLDLFKSIFVWCKIAFTWKLIPLGN